MVLNNFSIENISLLDQKWGNSQALGSSGGDVTISFASENFIGQFDLFDSFIADQEFQTDIIKAFASWEKVANIRFLLVADSEEVDIRIGYADIDGPLGIVGQTHFPLTGPMEKVQILLDSSESFFSGVPTNDSELNLNYVVSHEIGHAIGIGHFEGSGSVMSQFYDASIASLSSEDILAAQTVYGLSNVDKTPVNRFFNKVTGGHFFTADPNESDIVLTHSNFREEGVGFEALLADNTSVENAIPIYRFYNVDVGSHFFTASEQEQNVLLDLNEFRFEGVAFNAFQDSSASTTPVYRFFNLQTGGHLFTTFEAEKDVLMESVGFRFEGVGFYAYSQEVLAAI